MNIAQPKFYRLGYDLYVVSAPPIQIHTIQTVQHSPRQIGVTGHFDAFNPKIARAVEIYIYMVYNVTDSIE